MSEVERVRRLIFAEAILGLDDLEQTLIASHAVAARRGERGHGVAGVAGLLHGMLWPRNELRPTPLASDLAGRVVARARLYIDGEN